MADTHPDSWPAVPPPRRTGWTGGRVVSVVIGAVLALIALGALVAGGAALWADQTQRSNGYLDVTTGSAHTSGYALTSGVVTIDAGGQWAVDSVIGRLRVQATPTVSMKPLFVGIAPSGSAAAYLQGSHYASLTDIFTNHPDYQIHAGGVRPVPPGSSGIWTAKSSGPGTQTVTWTARTGQWTVVVMNADGSPGVSANVLAGMSAPALTPIAAGLLAGGSVLLVIAIVMIVIPVRRAGRPPAVPPGGTAGWRSAPDSGRG